MYHVDQYLLQSLYGTHIFGFAENGLIKDQRINPIIMDFLTTIVILLCRYLRYLDLLKFSSF